MAVVDRTHPLANRKALRIKDLQDETFIQFIDEYSVSGWRRIEQVCRAHGFTPKKRPMLGRPVTSYATTSPDGGVLILQKNLRQLKYLEDVNQTASIPWWTMTPTSSSTASTSARTSGGWTFARRA